MVKKCKKPNERDFMAINSLISVIMSVFDTPDDWLIQSIESILQQTYKNFEFIIVDDCCKESNKRILKKFEASDERIVLLKNERNLGLTKSLNVALTVSRGSFIARIDSDDLALPNRLEWQLRCFERNKNLVICGTNAWMLKDTQKIPFDVPLGTSRLLKCMLCWKDVFVHPSVMLNADVMKKNNLFYNEKFKTAQDYELWCRLSRYGDVMNLSERLCVYRIHDNQISTKSLTLQNLNRNAIILNNIKLLGIECSEERLSVFLTIIGYANKNLNVIVIVKETFVFCYRLFISYGFNSISCIRKFVWNSFWLVKHRICGNHFCYFSK